SVLVLRSRSTRRQAVGKPRVRPSSRLWRKRGVTSCSNPPSIQPEPDRADQTLAVARHGTAGWSGKGLPIGAAADHLLGIVRRYETIRGGSKCHRRRFDEVRCNDNDQFGLVALELI